MPSENEDIRALLDAIETQWNAAEAYVKKVERLRRGLVVMASINEFRYAGRRLVDAYTCIKCCETSPEKKAEALTLFGEVRQFCLRAQHDAMDACVTYIDQALAKYEDNFGADLINDKFPPYLAMKKNLKEISGIMSQSRGDRTARDGLYLQIRDEKIEELIEHHYSLETSEAILKSAFSSRIKKEKQEAWRWGAGTVIALVAAIATVVAIIPKHNKTVAQTIATSPMGDASIAPSQAVQGQLTEKP